MNRLGQATSPYLLQHKDNPVDWYEWGPAAFAEARRRDVPVFLSIGYSSCHWCHVMAHESFEDERLAARLNEHFVSIKVDREERPDIDAIYMEATVAMTGSGGWPMSVFLDHDQQPFYAGTYFPPEPRHGSPSLTQLLEAITEAWTSRRPEIAMASGRLTEALQMNAGVGVDGVDIDEAVVVFALQQLRQQFDWTRGGFGGAPKFPPSMVLEFLLREAARTGNDDALEMAERTLQAMARGGIYDQLGGGFARYSVDADWVVPHFEKMLYDNALLLRVYAHWWRLTGSPPAERVVRGTATFLLDEMRTPEGGFAASLDADTAGIEGRFYVWSPAQLREVLGEDDAAWAERLLDVTALGSFEHGLSTLQMRQDPTDDERWQRIRSSLLKARSERVHPGRDDKVVTAWNGLTIAALAECGGLFAEPQWVAAAEDAARLLLRLHVRDEDGMQVLRTSKDGVAGRSAGVLEDYANLAEGLLALAQVTGDDVWTEQAGRLLDAILLRFSSVEGGFQRTADDAEQLIVRPRELADSAEPSGWAATANAMLTFAARTGSTEYRERALQALAPLAQVGTTAPRAAGWALAACSAVLDGPAEITVAAPVGHALHALALRATAPGAVVIVTDEAAQATAMVCRHSTCTLPTGDAAELAAHIGARR